MKHESFPDGLVIVHDNRSKSGIGNLPREDLKERCRLRYREKTVGVTQFYAALEYNTRIERMIRCPRRDEVSALDIAEIVTADGGAFYRVMQIRYPEDTSPPVMDLSLERVDVT